MDRWAGPTGLSFEPCAATKRCRSLRSPFVPRDSEPDLAFFKRPLRSVREDPCHPGRDSGSFPSFYSGPLGLLAVVAGTTESGDESPGFFKRLLSGQRFLPRFFK